MRLPGAYSYDVFISYSHRDRHWVDDELLPGLEQKGFHACIDHRDFKGGVPVVENIQEAVETSRKTVMVLTQEYLNSAWAQFEGLMLQTRDPANRTRRLIPLRREECSLPDRIAYLTYVDFAGPEDLDVEWNKLFAALGPPSINGPNIPPSRPASDPEPVADTSRSAREGLEALIELTAIPQVRASAAAFGAVFATSRRQIEVLAHYKDLHDLLHTLQFRCYNYLMNLVRNVKRALDDSSIWENAFDCEVELQENIVLGLKRFLEEGTLSQGQAVWVKGLTDNLNVVCVAIEDRDAAGLEAALRPVNRVLGVQPVRINTRLNEAARALPLPDLAEALGRMHDQLALPAANHNAARKVKEGVGALETLSGALDQLIREHDRWQEIDIELRRIEATVGQDLAELTSSWPYLRGMTQQAGSDGGGDWANFLALDIRKLDDAVEAHDQSRIRQSFSRYRTRVSNRFYHVDLTLKELCGSLRGVGEPLAILTEVI
jgi:hypothetical protein